MTTLETDYLIIGAGAAGMAFADTLLAETDAHITLVDRRAKPGGHWNEAYPFVTLHQPSAFYGVNSLALGSGEIDREGLNQGMAELASGAELRAYYERVLQRQLLPSGRVRWLPMSQVTADGGVQSLLSGQTQPVTVRRKVVDAQYLSPRIPAEQAPRFEVEPGVQVVAPHALPGVWLKAGAAGQPPRRLVVLGAGKTAMDVCVWLLSSGADPAQLRWVVPRDSWLVNRVTTQTRPEFFREAIGGQAEQVEAFAEATSVEHLFQRLHERGVLLKVAADRTPTMFHLATVTPAEVQVLRRIEQVVRRGRVLALRRHEMVLQHGTEPLQGDELFIDCTASAVEPRPLQPIFQDGRIVLQMVRLPQPTFSAALIAWVEAHGGSDRDKNRLCGTVPFPHRLEDYPRAMLATMWNQGQWGQDKALKQWMRESRLDGFSKLMSCADRDNPEHQAIMARLKQATPAAMANLQRLAAQAAQVA